MRYPRVGGRRQRHFAGTSFQPRELPENAATPTRRVHAVLGSFEPTRILTVVRLSHHTAFQMNQNLDDGAIVNNLTDHRKHFQPFQKPLQANNTHTAEHF